jgi:drug/metabolite transporter (DMT)-like permease
MTDRPQQQRADLVGAGLVALAAACFGTLGPLSRFANAAGVASLPLVTWRAALGAGVVLGFIGLRRVVRGRPSGWSVRDIPVRDRWFMAAAAAANCILNFAAFVAFERTSIALTLLVFYLYPAGVALASTLWFGDRLDRSRWAALGISLVGTALVLAGAGPLGELDGLGIGLAFVAALAQVFYVLAARHGFAHVPGPQAAAFTMGGASIRISASRFSRGRSCSWRSRWPRSRPSGRCCSPASSERASRRWRSSSASAAWARRPRRSSRPWSRSSASRWRRGC